MVPALFFLIAFFSEVVGTLAGFGSSVFFVPLAGLLFGFHDVLALTSILHVFSNAAKLVLFGRDVNWKLLFLMGIPSTVFVILGALLTRQLELKYAELILGLFLVFLSFLLWFRPTLRLAPTSLNAITSGGVAGFLAGLIGTGGAVRGLVLAAFDLEKRAFVATSAAIDSGVDLSRMIVYLRSGYLTENLYWFVPGLFVTAYLGSYTGKLLLKRIQQQSFRRIVLLLILAIGLTTISRFVIELVP